MSPGSASTRRLSGRALAEAMITFATWATAHATSGASRNLNALPLRGEGPVGVKSCSLAHRPAQLAGPVTQRLELGLGLVQKPQRLLVRRDQLLEWRPAVGEPAD